MAGKTAAHKQSIIRSQVIELLRHGMLKTTPVKAKILKSKIDQLITLAKRNDIAGKNEIMQFLPTERATERFYKILPKFADRNSGYTKIIRTLPRKGDNAEQSYVVLFSDEEPVKKSRIQKTLDQQKTKKKTKK